MDPPPAVETVLVPVDGSDAAERAVEYAVAIAAQYGAGLHVTIVLAEEASRELEAGVIDDADVAADTESLVAPVEAAAAAADVPVSLSATAGFSTARKLVHPGSVILDTAEQVGADFLVVPRESGIGEDDVLEKAAEYVLAYASQPVLSV